MNNTLTLERFLNNLLSKLAGTLEEVVGVAESSGFIAIVGQKVGEELNDHYQKHYGACPLSAAQVAESMVSLKKSIAGDFYLIEQNEKIISLGNHRCPFGEAVIGKTSLCMMTSNVFGIIASQNLGYAKVELAKTIAAGDKECLVHVYLDPDLETSKEAIGQEYYRL
jgi:predicted ArsR family transcriptional regulator